MCLHVYARVGDVVAEKWALRRELEKIGMDNVEPARAVQHARVARCLRMHTHRDSDGVLWYTSRPHRTSQLTILHSLASHLVIR